MSDDAPTIGEMISQYQKLASHIEEVEDSLKPYREAAETIRECLQQELLAQKLQNFKSPDGTAYLSRTLSARVTDRDAYLDFIEDGHWEFLDARVLKEPQKEWMEKNPKVLTATIGVTTETIIKCNIRKS